MNAREAILSNKTALGIEFGSTRIKAVLVDEKMNRQHLEDMSGKTDMKTVSGLTVWKTSGAESGIAIRRL